MDDLLVGVARDVLDPRDRRNLREYVQTGADAKVAYEKRFGIWREESEASDACLCREGMTVHAPGLPFRRTWTTWPLASPCLFLRTLTTRVEVLIRWRRLKLSAYLLR